MSQTQALSPAQLVALSKIMQKQDDLSTKNELLGTKQSMVSDKREYNTAPQLVDDGSAYHSFKLLDQNEVRIALYYLTHLTTRKPKLQILGSLVHFILMAEDSGANKQFAKKSIYNTTKDALLMARSDTPAAAATTTSSGQAVGPVAAYVHIPYRYGDVANHEEEIGAHYHLSMACHDQVNVKFKDVDSLPSMSLDEVAALCGSHIIAMCKIPTAQNLAAFNEKRTRVIQAFLGGLPLAIFVPGSRFLTRDTLLCTNAAATAYPVFRKNLIRFILDNGNAQMEGPARLLWTFFELLRGTGLASLILIKNASLDFKDVLFPATIQFYSEWIAYYSAMAVIAKIPERERLYSKAIMGNEFTPVELGAISNIFVIARELEKIAAPTLNNFAGGIITPECGKIIKDIMTSRNLDTIQTTPAP